MINIMHEIIFQALYIYKKWKNSDKYYALTNIVSKFQPSLN